MKIRIRPTCRVILRPRNVVYQIDNSNGARVLRESTEARLSSNFLFV